MNIAIFSPNRNPYSETFIQAHKNCLQGKIFYYYGRNPITLEGKYNREPRYKTFFLRLKTKIGRKPSGYFERQMLLRDFKLNKIDVALVEYGTHAHTLLSILKEADIPFVVHFHGYDASEFDVLEKANYYKNVFSNASKIISVSKKMSEMLLNIDCPKEKLIYNVYGPRPEFFEIKPQFENQQFISVGRFTNKKAPYYSILSFKKVLKYYPGAKLIMAGDGELLNTCKNLVKVFGLEDNIHFPGIITAEEFKQYLQSSRAYVQHSITADNGDMEGTPLAILEASAAGIPVISTYHAGIPDVILHEITGLLCNEHDVDAMAKNMIRLLDDEKLAIEMGKMGKKRVIENFSLERHITLLDKVLNECSLNKN
ncbi:glycosyltransferase [Aequorivita echinoideorum]|uniref:Glycosyltransferase n=1 Tax=Aequorivita echinoideorum TaxID=1549647 RepID=A0ABS5S7U3_9FLAO|nr:glycosyltransferase [Aequorivita echinoideorum]MBT0608442.1 glycosyltransferase [Aequorivita echinoideorum]